MNKWMKIELINYRRSWKSERFNYDRAENKQTGVNRRRVSSRGLWIFFFSLLRGLFDSRYV